MSETSDLQQPKTCRIALACLPFPPTPDDAVTLAKQAVADAGAEDADIVCFPECFVPGYRGTGKSIPPPDPGFLQRAWSQIAAAAARADVAVVLGTERIVDSALRATALVITREGEIAGFQDKVQLAPEEDGLYSPGIVRRIFHAPPLVFGIAICHEAWRYPETVRWAARRGANIVFHPHFHEGEPGSRTPSTFAADPDSIFEKAMLCRAAENTCYFASVNCAAAGSSTASAVIRPDGTLLAHQPYGKPGLLIVDIDLAAATGLYALRCKY